MEERGLPPGPVVSSWVMMLVATMPGQTRVTPMGAPFICISTRRPFERPTMACLVAV